MNYKRLYLNGFLSPIPGLILIRKGKHINLYAIWNGLMYWLWKKRDTDFVPLVLSAITAFLLVKYLIMV